MIPAPFDYRRPDTLEQAIELLQRHGEGAKLLAGGHSLLPVLKARLAQPRLLVDIGRIPGLSGVTRSNRFLHVGALTTHDEVASSDLLIEHCPLVAETASRIGDLQVRNRGTVGGSLAHADPAADYPAAMLALGAEFVITGPDGARQVGAEDFFTGLYATALGPSDILTSIRIPVPEEKSGSAYVKAAQQASGFAVCGVAATLTLGADGAVATVRVGITGIAETAYRAKRVEDAIVDKPATDENLRAAAAFAAQGVDPLDDLYASADFRRHLAGVWTERALRAAARRAA